MKCFLISLSLCLLICANVRAQQLHPNFEKGFSDQYKAENTLGQYAFGYNEDHTSGGSFRRETGDRFGNKVGSYGLRIADGRIRIVNYVADHNGYRADVMTNEPGIANQNSNGYFQIIKKGFRGVLIPGFRNSAEAPHVVFQRGNDEKNYESFSHSNTNEPRSTFSKSIDEPHRNVDHLNINEPRSTFSKSIDEPHRNVNHGNINEPRSSFSKSIDESQSSFNHGNKNEERLAFNQGNINEPHNLFNHGNIETFQNTFGKNHEEEYFTESNTAESIVAIPLKNGLEATTLENSSQGDEDAEFYAQAEAVTGVNDVMGNRVQDVSKDLKQHGNDASDSLQQSHSIELPEFLTESRAIEVPAK